MTDPKLADSTEEVHVLFSQLPPQGFPGPSSWEPRSRAGPQGTPTGFGRAEMGGGTWWGP